MSNEPQYKMVNGELVALTQAEIDAIATENVKITQAQNVASTTLDMGKSMYEILTGEGPRWQPLI